MRGPKVFKTPLRVHGWGRTFLELHFLIFPFFCFFSSSCFILVFVEKGEVLGLQIMSFQTQENKARCLSNHRKAPPPDAPQFPRVSAWTRRGDQQVLVGLPPSELTGACSPLRPWTGLLLHPQGRGKVKGKDLKALT